MNLAAKPIRICFVAPKAYPLFDPAVDAVFGGAEVDLYLLATELAKDKSFDISFVTADYGQEKIEKIQNVTIIKSIDFKKNFIVGARQVCIAAGTADADIYFQEAVSWGTFLVALFCKLNKKIFTYRTANEGECNGRYAKQHFLTGKAFHWSLRNAKQVIVQNQIDKVNLLRTIAIGSQVIANAHHLSTLSNSDRNNILWVGRSTEVKRPQLFMDLAESLPDQRFVMICQHATDDQKYEDLIARAKLLDNLEFIERVGFDEIESYFQCAKVFVNTSSTEGFPNTFIQAAKNAVPILSLKVDPDGFLNKFQCGMCANDDSNRFLDMLKQLLNSDKAAQLGSNGRSYAEANHDITKIVEKYKILFKDLIQK